MEPFKFWLGKTKPIFGANHGDPVNTEGWVKCQLPKQDGTEQAIDVGLPGPYAAQLPESTKESGPLSEQPANESPFNSIRNLLKARIERQFSSKDANYAGLEARAMAGDIVGYDPHVEMTGAVNLKNVTCWLDSLLFAMFATLDAYEPMLIAGQRLPTAPQRELATLLRLWVNMLRSGTLIPIRVTEKVLKSLVANGWKEVAPPLAQQDVCEAYEQITSILGLPLMQLQVDIFHDGEEEQGDHKIAHERLLQIAVPAADTDGAPVRLEECLEDYFNTRINVCRKRKIRRSNHLSECPLLRMLSKRSPLAVDGGNDWGFGQSSLPVIEASSKGAAGDWPLRHHSAGLIQNIQVEEEETYVDKEATRSGHPSRTGSITIKAAMLPAWQFFRLIPWGSIVSEPNNSQEVALNLDGRPVVAICLKRYSMDNNCKAVRVNTRIDIPESFRLPYFVGSNGNLDSAGNEQISAMYKFELQSVVCHRGTSIEGGHYVSFARVAPHTLTENRHRIDDAGPPPGPKEARWVMHNDLTLRGRVTPVEDIHLALKTEMPYLLFYQVVPIMDDAQVGEVPMIDDAHVGAVPWAMGNLPSISQTVEDEPSSWSFAGGSYGPSYQGSSRAPSLRSSCESLGCSSSGNQVTTGVTTPGFSSQFLQVPRSEAMRARMVMDEPQLSPNLEPQHVHEPYRSSPSNQKLQPSFWDNGLAFFSSLFRKKDKTKPQDNGSKAGSSSSKTKAQENGAKAGSSSAKAKGKGRLASTDGDVPDGLPELRERKIWRISVDGRRGDVQDKGSRQCLVM